MDPERQPHVAPKWQLRETLGGGGGAGEGRGVGFRLFVASIREDPTAKHHCTRVLDTTISIWWVPPLAHLFFCFSFVNTRRLVMWAWFGDPTTGREIRSIVGPSISEWFLACELNPQGNGAHDCVDRSMVLPMRLVMWGSLCNTIMGLCCGYILVHVAVFPLKKKDTLTQRAQ